MKKKKICIGIDLGTTNSEICIVENGKTKLLKIDDSPIVPSVVSIDEDGSVLVGHQAVNNQSINPENTISLIKRKMGKELVFKINDKDYTPPMISSLILSRLKMAAEKYLQAPVDQAVITVPAFFNEQQREATKQAGELAGLEVLRLLNEPTAAALAYSLGRKVNERSLIYDLGGGTFDVSIVDLSHEAMEVLASEGDTELGGADFDLMIAHRVNQSFIEKTGIDLTKDPKGWARLLQAAEKAKIRLSTESEATIIEEFITQKNGEAHHLTYRITRLEFEVMIEKIILKTLDSVKRAMQQANLTALQLDRVILVGGSTYIPLVSELLQKELSIVPQVWIDPALVVAIGAAIESSNLNGESLGPVMLDITPHSLGLEILDANLQDKNEILIRKNSPLPATVSRIFYRCFEEQDTVKLTVYQGESTKVDHNLKLGDFQLEGLKDSEELAVHIKFQLDRNGLLHVTVTDVSSGKTATHTLKRKSSQRKQTVNLADISSLRIQAEDEHILSEEYLAPSIEDIEEPVDDLIARATKLLEKQELDSTDTEELQAAIEAKKQDANSEKLAELLYYLE